MKMAQTLSRARILEAQRSRPAKNRRIDHYPGREVVKIIDAHVGKFVVSFMTPPTHAAIDGTDGYRGIVPAI